MLTEASFMTTAPHAFEAEPVMIMPGIVARIDVKSRTLRTV
jgi:hypothetical protein